MSVLESDGCAQGHRGSAGLSLQAELWWEGKRDTRLCHCHLAQARAAGAGMPGGSRALHGPAFAVTSCRGEGVNGSPRCRSTTEVHYFC